MPAERRRWLTLSEPVSDDRQKPGCVKAIILALKVFVAFSVNVLKHRFDFFARHSVLSQGVNKLTDENGVECPDVCRAADDKFAELGVHPAIVNQLARESIA